MNYLSKSVFFFLVCLLTLRASAQNKDIFITSKTNSDKSVSLTSEKSYPGTLTLVVNFRELNNSSVGVTTFELKNSRQNFLTLMPSNKDQGITYSYNYSYIKGKLNPKYNPQFVYILPYNNGKKTRVVESSFFNAAYFGSTTPEDWKSYHFFTDQADTVIAVRKGIVVTVVDSYDENADIKYTNKVNEIIIEHTDGTLATYRGFKKGLWVKEGETVLPGSQLGVNGLSDNRYGISLMLSYLKSNDFASKNNVKESKSMYGFITPHFYTSENPNGVLTNQKDYTASLSLEITQKEMSKKELKGITKR